MRLVPLGIGSSFSAAPMGWYSNLVDGKLLVDAAPQAVLQLRRLGVAADDLEAVAITHLHGDHVFGFPFLLAERSPELEPIPVVGPEGTGKRLAQLCSLAFSVADPAKMVPIELPPGRKSEAAVGDFRLLAAPTEHTPDSLGYLITGPEGTRLACSGDAAWCDGLRLLLSDADAALVEMTFIKVGKADHLSLAEHLPKIVAAVPAAAPILLTHLSRPRREYLDALRRLRRGLPADEARLLDRVEPAEELREYVF